MKIRQETIFLQNVENIPLQRALELDITYVCNMACRQCNRGLGILPSQNMMSVDQVSKVLQESRELSQPFLNIRVLGGEPTLHPHLPEILNELCEYKLHVPDCTITLWSHGYGNKVQKKLAELPSWLKVKISPKLPVVGGDNFDAFLAAPLDYIDEYDAEFHNGCSYIGPGRCGVGVSLYGIYACPVAGAIDRIVGLDVGMKSLDEISTRKFKEQCDNLCRYCGHYLVDHGIELDRNTISRTWHELRDNYKEQKPELTIY